jgi:hypothetical protein
MRIRALRAPSGRRTTPAANPPTTATTSRSTP